MTANQIAHQNQVSQDDHWKRADAEVERHNIQMENLQDIANKNEAERNRISEDYNKTWARLTERQQDIDLQLKSADLNLKAQLEQEKIDIQRELADAEIDYKDRVAQVNEWDAQVRSDIAAENKRHNERMEYIEQVEAENRMWDLGMERDYKTNMVTLQFANYDLAVLNANKNWENEKEKRIIEGVSAGLRFTSDMMGIFSPIVLGGNNSNVKGVLNGTKETLERPTWEGLWKDYWSEHPEDRAVFTK